MLSTVTRGLPKIHSSSFFSVTKVYVTVMLGYIFSTTMQCFFSGVERLSLNLNNVGIFSILLCGQKELSCYYLFFIHSSLAVFEEHISMLENMFIDICNRFLATLLS